MATIYQYWQHKKSNDVIAVKLRDGNPIRFAGPLKKQQYKSSDGRMLNLKLELFHYDRRFTEDPYHFTLCEDVKNTKLEEREKPKVAIGLKRRKNFV